MRPTIILALTCLALAACERTGGPAPAEGTPSIASLRADSDTCAAKGYPNGSTAMVDCMKQLQAERQATAPAGT